MIKKDHSENQFTQTALSDIGKYIEENFKRNNINITNDQLETEKITKKKNKNNIRHKETIIQIQNNNEEVISEIETQENLLAKKRGRPPNKNTKSIENQKNNININSNTEEDIEIPISNNKKYKIQNKKNNIISNPINKISKKTSLKKDASSKFKSRETSIRKENNFESPMKNSRNRGKSLEKAEKEKINSPFVDLKSPKKENLESNSISRLKSPVSKNNNKKEESFIIQETESKLNIVKRKNKDKKEYHQNLDKKESSESISRSDSKRKIESKNLRSKSESKSSLNLENREKKKSLRSSDNKKSIADSLESKRKIGNSLKKIVKFSEKENLNTSKVLSTSKSTKSREGKSESENLKNLKELRTRKSTISSVEKSVSLHTDMVKRTPSRSESKKSEINTDSKISLSNSKKDVKSKEKSEPANFDIKLKNNRESKSKESNKEKTNFKLREKASIMKENKFSTPIKSATKEYYKPLNVLISKSPLKLHTRSSGNSNQKMNSYLTFKNASSGNKSESPKKSEKVSERNLNKSESPSKFEITPTIKERKIKRKDGKLDNSSTKKMQIILQENGKPQSETKRSSRSNKFKNENQLLGKKQLRIDLDRSLIKGNNWNF